MDSRFSLQNSVIHSESPSHLHKKASTSVWAKKGTTANRINENKANEWGNPIMSCTSTGTVLKEDPYCT